MVVLENNFLWLFWVESKKASPEGFEPPSSGDSWKWHEVNAIALTEAGDTIQAMLRAQLRVRTKTGFLRLLISSGKELI